MHRQSLGSPSLKLQHGGIILLKDDTSSSTSPSNEALSPGGGRAVEEEKLKKLKPKPKTTTTEIYIHFIPMLTLLCLLVLYLSSHNPSQIGNSSTFCMYISRNLFLIICCSGFYSSGFRFSRVQRAQEFSHSWRLHRRYSEIASNRGDETGGGGYAGGVVEESAFSPAENGGLLGFY